MRDIAPEWAAFVSRAADSGTILVPIPLSRKKLRKRGFNQSFLLAKAVADRYPRFMVAEALARTEDRVPQAGLKSRKEREENVRNVFSVIRPGLVRGRHVIIIDDVLTTGSTAREARRALEARGAASVRVRTLAR